MKSITLTGIAILAAVTVQAAPRDYTNRVQYNLICQQNLEDGRLMVSNGDALPGSDVRSTFTITKYTPVEVKDGWSHGPCEAIVSFTPVGR